MTVDELRDRIKFIKQIRRTDPEYAIELEEALRKNLTDFIHRSRATPMWRKVLEDELSVLD